MDIRNGGKALRRCRQARGWTLKEVTREMEAQGIRIGIGDISRLETGRIANPSLGKVVLYGTFLGMTPNDIARAYGLWALPEDAENRLTRVALALGKVGEQEREWRLSAIERLALSQAPSS
jgi:transcriptional regulator with XRE-family HTH domain